jgi:hypothetical protein
MKVVMKLQNEALDEMKLVNNCIMLDMFSEGFLNKYDSSNLTLTDRIFGYHFCESFVLLNRVFLSLKLQQVRFVIAH